MAYLKEVHRREKAGESLEGYDDTQLTAIMFDLWLAGTNTVTVTLRFALFYILHHPQVQTKIQEELDSYFGGSDRPISMADKPSLPYITATIQETQRCANIVPINVPHSPTQDIEIGGCIIRKGQTVVPQMSVIQSDPSVFPDPDSFKPQRFLEKDEKTLKKVDKLMPFSMGKRICAGESLARMELFIGLATILRKFEIHPLEDEPLPPLQHGEDGIMSVIPTPFSIGIKLRT
jgi:cytochrome P450 family 33